MLNELRDESKRAPNEATACQADAVKYINGTDEAEQLGTISFSLYFKLEAGSRLFCMKMRQALMLERVCGVPLAAHVDAPWFDAFEAREEAKRLGKTVEPRHLMKLWREENGYSSAQLATMIGYAQSEISHMETGRKPVSFELAKAYEEVSKGELPMSMHANTHWFARYQEIAEHMAASQKKKKRGRAR